MSNSDNYYCIHKYSFGESWIRFWWVVQTSYQLDDLQNLAAWAKRKRLSGVRQAYQTKFIRAVLALKACYHEDGQLTRWARWFYHLSKICLPAPRYYQGYGARYKQG